MASMSCTMSKSNAYPETYFKAISTKNASNASSFNVDKNLLLDIFHLNKSSIEEAERIHREQVKNVQVTMTPLADEIAKARQRLIEFRGNVEHVAPIEQSFDVGSLKFFEKKMQEMQNALTLIQKQLSQFDARLSSVEKKAQQIQTPQAKPAAPPKKEQPKAQEDDDDVDLFASDSDDDEAKEKREKLLSAYNEKKSKKPALIAKSSILIDVKPWDDETDMKAMEAEVRKIEMDGLLWGASKLVPLAYGIHKLQINCVIEDDKVSTDALQEQIESIEDFVQSTDIAAFNKI